jgi:thermitase
VGLERNGSALAKLSLEWVGEVRSEISSINAYVVRLFPDLPVQSVDEFLRELPGVRYVEPNYRVFAFTTPNDPFFAQQYALSRVQASAAWGVWSPTRTVYIAIIDSGIDYTHPDLTNKIRRYSNGAIYGYDALNPIGWQGDYMDYGGHGTHCAGIAGAEINNAVGVAGIAAWNPNHPNSNSAIQLMPVKVLDEEGTGTVSTVAMGISWAADNGAHILSLSLGTLDFSTAISDAVNYAWTRGCLLVAAAGNFASNAPTYPAHHSPCIAVAATDVNDQLTSFSQYGSWIDIAAPGQNILSTLPNNSYASWSGTSMACPLVAGAAAVLWSYNPTLTNQQVREALETQVDPYTPYNGRTIGSGKGRLNVYRALQAVGAGAPPQLNTLTLSPTQIVGGNSVTGTVQLTAPAPGGGFTVSLGSSNPNVATVPSSVTVPAGSVSASFPVATSSVPNSTTVTIIATAAGVQRAASLTVLPSSTGIQLSSLSISPTQVTGGSRATGTVTLTAPAPAGGVVVSLRSSSTRAQVPSSVTVPAGATSASFTITTRSARNIATVTITATYNSVSRSAQLTVMY